MQYPEIQACISEQIKFFSRGHSGCMFAAHAAKYHEEVGWEMVVCRKGTARTLKNVISFYRRHPAINTICMIFPDITEYEQLEALISNLLDVDCVEGSAVSEQGHLCTGLRLKIVGKTSWISGFGPFAFLPPTRQAPYTALVVRVKDKPNYDVEVKKTPEDQLHVANILLERLDPPEFKRISKMTYRATSNILGHKANLLSAAKTTFAIPEKLMDVELKGRLL